MVVWDFSKPVIGYKRHELIIFRPYGTIIPVLYRIFKWNNPHKLSHRP